MIRLIVGLGNPGSQYAQTRHNAGFIFVDRVAAIVGARWQQSAEFRAEMANGSFELNKLLLLKPMAFMNRSGYSVVNAVRYYKFKPDELLVVHDELDLPEGSARLKFGGGHAGHNGLRDIIASLGSNEFYRLRLGIGRPTNGTNVADFVLSKPAADSASQLKNGQELALGSLSLIMKGDLSAANAILN